MIQIREAVIEDMTTVRQIAYDTWPSAYLELLGPEQLSYMLTKFYSISALQHQLKILQHRFILALEDESPVGFASYSTHKDDPSVYHLNKIYVLPSQQGKNTGKQIINHVIEHIKKVDAVALQLNVNRYNKAIHFYEKVGFKIIREEDIDIGEGYFMNDYVMELKL